MDRKRFFDIRREGRRSLTGLLWLWVMNPDFRVVWSYRFSHAAWNLYSRHKVIGLVPQVLSRLVRLRFVSRHHVSIDAAAEIGPGLYIGHHFGIVVGPSRIGANCTLMQNVTIGAGIAGGESRVPTLGDNVWIGPGATLSGPIVIGNNVTIAAGTVLSRSVPDGCLVAGNPGRVVQQNYDNSALAGVPVPGPTGEAGRTS